MSYRYGTDPLSGVWAFLQKLTSAQMNNLLGWVRGLDTGLQLLTVHNWPYLHTVSEQVSNAAWDAGHKYWILVGDSASASRIFTIGNVGLTPSATSPTDIGTLISVASSPGGTTVAGSGSTASTAQKLLSTTTGLAWTARNLSGATTATVRCMYYDPINLQFLAGLTGDKIEYSATGVDATWTAATTSGSGFNFNDMTSDGSSILVACCYGSATSFDTSTDGHTWSARTVPSGNYYTVEYHAGWGKFFAATPTTCIQSSDGITWSAGSTTVPFTSSAYEHKFCAFGDYMLCASSESATNYGGYLYISDDECVTWTMINHYLDSAVEPTFISSSGSQLCMGHDNVMAFSLRAPTAV